MKINEGIFKSYDIRAIVGEDLNPDVAEIIGKSFGTKVRELGEKKVIVGHDNRKSSDSLNDGLIKGLLSTGVDVIDIGLVTSPILYYARKMFGIGPAVMITASHNTGEYNGFKLCLYESEENIYGEGIQDLKRFTLKGDFIEGEGTLSKAEIVQNYIDMICDKVKLGKRKLKVVVDCGNGTASVVALSLLEKLGCEVIPIYCDSDPDFPNHHPDPSIPENLKDAAKLVKQIGADIGIGFDGDGDRIGVIDENGVVLLGDMFMIMMLRDVAKTIPIKKGIVEVKCSKALADEIEKLGGEPVYFRTGNPYIKAEIRKENIPFSGEMSGHMYFLDEYYGYDDATYAAARVLRTLSNTEKNVSELLEGVNKYYSTPEVQIPIEEEKKKDAVEMITKYFAERGHEIITVDGARVLFENGWGLVRASNTSPILSARYESSSYEGLEYIQNQFQTALKQI
jgi:Phosphomannomutase